MMPAGPLIPEVFMKGYGFFKVDPIIVAPVYIPYVVSSLETTSGENNGGYLNTIVGQGFAGVGLKQSLNSVSFDKGKSGAEVTVTLCNQSAAIK